MEKTMTGTVRKLTFNKINIYNAVVLALRSRNIRDDLLGYDLIKGSIFGKIRYPEKDTKEIIENAIDNCSLPGHKDTYDDGMEEILKSLEVVMDVTTSEIENLKVIEELLNSTAEEVRRELCHIKSRNLVGAKAPETLAQNIIKNLVYKKLVDDSSTWECMYKYAAKKIAHIDESNVDIDEIRALAAEAVPEGMTLEEYVESLVDKAYDEE